MSNSTDPLAQSVHGGNPQNLVEKILRNRIYSSLYWKEDCFGLTAESLVDKSVDLVEMGGHYGGNQQPTDFLCLLLKMLQLQPQQEIVDEFIQNQEYKYVTALGCFYLRLTCPKAVTIYKTLEPLYNDYRKLRKRNAMGKWDIIHMDEVIDALLHDEYFCDIALPRIPDRMHLENNDSLPPRISVLQEELQSSDSQEDDDDDDEDDSDDK